MAVYRYPQEVHDFVKEHAPQMRDPGLVEACNAKLGTSFTVKSMKAFRGNHGYKNGLGHYSSEEYWECQTYFPKGMIEFIRENSWHVTSEEMAEIVNARFGTHFTKQRMKVFRQRHGISSGGSGWYARERSPGNKGRKQSEYCSPEKLAASRATQFKKGNRPVNELPVGTISKDRHGYLIRKKAMEGGQWERWEFLHRAVWEEHNGPVPEGMCIAFKDGNKENCNIENLILLRRTEIATMSKKGYWFEDPDLTETAAYVVRLQQTAKRKKKGDGKNEHA